MTTPTTSKELAGRYSFVCNAGCGVCSVKVKPFEYERTETLAGEHLGSKYHPQIVSSCCGSEVHVYDNHADQWGAEVTLATPPAAAPAETAPSEAVGLTDEQIDAIAAPWLAPDGQANDSDVRQIVRAALQTTKPQDGSKQGSGEPGGGGAGE